MNKRIPFISCNSFQIKCESPDSLEEPALNTPKSSLHEAEEMTICPSDFLEIKEEPEEYDEDYQFINGVPVLSVTTSLDEDERKLLESLKLEEGCVAEENANDDSKTKEIKISSEDDAEGLYFKCTHCPFRKKLLKENISEIVDHVTPEDRFNYVPISTALDMYCEDVVLSLFVSTVNTNIAMVKLNTNLKCKNCGLVLAGLVRNIDTLSSHIEEHCSSHSIESNRCMYCNSILKDAALKDHYNIKSNLCNRACMALLQRLSFMCKNYAGNLKPICIVCSQRHWPYKGQTEFDVLCGGCRSNLLSGDIITVSENVTGCALCLSHCSDKFVLHHPNELESVYVGEACIKKLESPKIDLFNSCISDVKSRAEKLFMKFLSEAQFPSEFQKDGWNQTSRGVHSVFEFLTKVQKNGDRISNCQQRVSLIKKILLPKRRINSQNITSLIQCEDSNSKTYSPKRIKVLPKETNMNEQIHTADDIDQR